ncbi:aspartate kinase [Histidinibacterium aquaticum]|uniref:aspartate kinase n=1 Tax=Histidinibacterium aquaticum TaxID=2613962 RepID=A0A5J5GKJ5_9RHOB|nr:aspartate kinase [Histidinibacterium aquaticum]KAA9008183.1 aspartate kinase [Histidinibacterium aquaticum]
MLLKTVNDSERAELPFSGHTVEKIGGTSMSRVSELVDTLFKGGREGEKLYNRIFVVSAFGGITDMLLEHKKSGQPGVYAAFTNDEDDSGWLTALKKVAEAMRAAHAEVLDHPADLTAADEFVRERVEGARSCLFDLQRLCSYGHFQLSNHMLSVRELLSGIGESHSAFVTALLLQRKGVNARNVDLSGWRDEGGSSLEERIRSGLSQIDLKEEMPIVTGYAQCSGGLMKEFDRGYSEVTFANIAALTGAREAIIHKEFHLSSADPKLVGQDKVRKLGHTNYDVADQLSNMGMEAIHPKAAKTLRQADVPLRVTNAFEPDDPGTLIDDKPAESPGFEIVCGLNVVALELFEQDMVGVKGYDATILDALKRHNVWIVSKTSSANTITHYVQASLKTARRVIADLAEVYPSAEIGARSVALVSAIGRDLKGLKGVTRGLKALAEAEVDVIALHQTPRNVNLDFVIPAEDRDKGVAALHKELIEGDQSKAAEPAGKKQAQSAA